MVSDLAQTERGGGTAAPPRKQAGGLRSQPGRLRSQQGDPVR